MKLATLRQTDAHAVGVILPEGVLDLAAAWPVLMSRVGPGGGPPACVTDLMARGDLLLRLRQAIAGTPADALHSHLRPVLPGTLCAPVPRPGKLICVASNYAAHIAESGREAPPDRNLITPWLFLKPPTTVIGPGDAIPVPHQGQAIDWEIELGVVIGKPGRYIRRDRALEHVFGYTIINDVSERRFKPPEGRPVREWDKFFDWLHGKWFDGFAPMGPVVASADEIPDPQAVALELRVNGRLRQQGTTANMIFPVAELIAFASSIMTLEPGDVIATGTPQGVGSATGEYLRPGDVVECCVDGIGVLRNPVIDDGEARRSA